MKSKKTRNYSGRPTPFCRPLLRDFRSPGSSRQGAGDGVAWVDAVLGGGAEVGSDAAEFGGACFGAESAGDLLLGFHRSDVALGLVVGPGDIGVVEEA